MRRRLALITCCFALFLGTAAAPTAAAPADPVISSINGIPGQTIDICVAGAGEVVSRLRYGRVTSPDSVPAGTWKIQARVASAGKCKGKLLATKTVTWEADRNYSLVFWRPLKAVNIKLFENDMSLPGTGVAKLTVRHTAKAAAIDIWLWQQIRLTAPFDPTIENLRKGSSSVPVTLPEREIIVEVRPAKRTRLWKAETAALYPVAGSVYQAYLIGTERRNYRIVFLGQDGEI